MSNTSYCIEFAGKNPYYMYTVQPNICKLAEHLNRTKKGMVKDKIVKVTISKGVDKRPVFMDSEYESQRFIETYEERLLEAAKELGQAKYPLVVV